MSELDELEVEYARCVSPAANDSCEQEFARCTCLDRARLALEQSGQVHCAGVMGELQRLFDGLADEYEMDPNRPCDIIRSICGG